MKIMVIDDELISRKKLTEILKDYGECLDFERGDQALIAFENALKKGDGFNLVTIDIFMPMLDGFLVLQKIRNLEGDMNIPASQRAKTVMVTASAERDKVLFAKSKGCDDYILKPFKEEDIIERLKTISIFKPESPAT